MFEETKEFEYDNEYENENEFEDEETLNEQEDNTDDNVEETNEDNNTQDEDDGESEEQQQEEQAQTTESNQEIINRTINKVVARERRRAEENLQPYDELAHILKQGLGEDENISISDLISKTKNFYEENGQHINNYVPKENKHDMEVLAKADAKDIIDAGAAELTSEYERLKNKSNLSTRESILFNELQNELAIRGAEMTLEKSGKDKNVLRNSEFVDFASKYRPDISILDIYDDYVKMTKKAEEKKERPLPAGSMKSNNNEKNRIKSFYTPDEVDKFTQKELLDNPKLLEAINKSMEKW